MITAILLHVIRHPGLINFPGYVAGIVIAVFIFGYLIYSLINSEKF
jgi:K+-transporting ATPase KdpF subunit